LDDTQLPVTSVKLSILWRIDYFFLSLKKNAMPRYQIHLSKEEVEELTSTISKGTHSSHTLKVAYVLLNCDEGEYSQKVSNEQLSKVLRVGLRTIDRIKKRMVEEGLEAVLQRRPTSRIYEPKVDGEVEAKLISLCCSNPPEGYARWSLRLLADKMIELKYVDSISHVAVHHVLKKTNLSLGK